MGMFDRIYFECPKCLSQVEVQSKAGECILHDFYADHVPLEIATDIDGEKVYCDKCNNSFTVRLKTLIPLTVKMKLE